MTRDSISGRIFYGKPVATFPENALGLRRKRQINSSRREGTPNGRERARHDRGRQDGRQGPVSRPGHLPDRGGDRRLSAHRARAPDRAGDRDGLRADLRRRRARPQSQPAASPLRLRPREARPCRHHRPAPLHRAAYAQARAGRADLHHLREQRRGGGDRPQDQQGGRGDQLRLDQRPSADHLVGRQAALHRERGGRDRLGDRPAGAQAAGQDQDAAAARRHRDLGRRPHRGGGRRRRAEADPDRHRGRPGARGGRPQGRAEAGPDRPLCARTTACSRSPASTATP